MRGQSSVAAPILAPLVNIQDRQQGHEHGDTCTAGKSDVLSPDLEAHDEVPLLQLASDPALESKHSVSALYSRTEEACKPVSPLLPYFMCHTDMRIAASMMRVSLFE